MRENKLAESESNYRQALALFRKVFGNQHSTVLNSLDQLTLVLRRRGNLEGAEDVLREILATRRKLLGDAHPDVATGLENLANVLEDAGKPDQAQAVRKEARAIRRAISLKSIRPREANAKPNLLDLSPFYSAGFLGNWHGDDINNDLASLPAWIQNLGGIDFDVRGLVQLGNQRRTIYDSEIIGIRVQRRCQRMHFLHGAIWGLDPDGTTIARYVWHFRDGSKQELPIVLGRNVLDWYAKPNPVTQTNLVVAWSGTNGKSKARGKTIQLYKTIWENPRPETDIESLDLISENRQAAVFVIAIATE